MGKKFSRKRHCDWFGVCDRDLEVHNLDLVSPGSERSQQASQFVFGKMASGVFRDAKFDFSGRLASGRIWLSGKTPSFIVEPFSEFSEGGFVP